MRPRIGVTARSLDDATIKRLRWYLESVRQAGGEPVVLAPGESSVGLDHLDGLLLSGGGDIHPRRYGQPIAGAEVSRIDEARDEMEIRLTRAALEIDMPVLAICRGIQLLNVAMNGGLVQDLGERHRTPTGAYKHHLVQVEAGSLLAATLGVSGQISVNTYHHQGIRGDTLAPGLRVSARAIPDTWLIEGVESPEHRFVLGIQW
ncbi:MAG: gamma-glutamyl-gamma-aminobutyrate hydrolase family protein, partial [Anaerolineae bacterium]|nr:gamma-glutamyl-gamma-aminobutyrate hydrolase family protein [Anaerolineae bacterium]